MKEILFVALVAVASVANAAQAATPQDTLLSVATFTAGGSHVDLSTFERADGRVCRQYVKDTSMAAGAKQAAITVGTYCDGDTL